MQSYLQAAATRSPILITGANGFLGSRIRAALSCTGPVICPTHQELDITSLSSVCALLSRFKPRCVIHCAAISDTGYTQQHPEQAYAVNVLGAKHVALACRQIGAKLLYMSSDQVYNGCANLGPLPETCPLEPESVYGVQKLQCEEVVSLTLPEAVGLRLTWMYDLPGSAYKNAGLLYQLCMAHERGQSLSFASREYRGITYVPQIVSAIPALLQLPGGVYNCGAAACGTTFEIALAAARLMNLPLPHQLVKEDPARYPVHPRNLSMDCGKLASYGISFSSTMDGLKAACL